MHHHSCNKLYVFFSFLPDPLTFPIERAMGNKTHTTGVWCLMLRLWISQKTFFFTLSLNIVMLQVSTVSE